MRAGAYVEITEGDLVEGVADIEAERAVAYAASCGNLPSTSNCSLG